jgi:hypothetical protein
MECIKCEYKSQKTLYINMKRMHPVEEVIPEVKADVSDMK